MEQFSLNHWICAVLAYQVCAAWVSNVRICYVASVLKKLAKSDVKPRAASNNANGDGVACQRLSAVPTVCGGVLTAASIRGYGTCKREIW